MIEQTDISSILEKVRKLLALSTSSNPHEAALAAAKAQELLAQHNLEMSQVDTHNQTTGFEQTALSTGRSVWRRHLLHIIAKYNFCDAIYDPDTKCMMLIGERHNAEVVSHLNTYLVAQLEPMATVAYHNSQSALAAITWKLTIRVIGRGKSGNVQTHEEGNPRRIEERCYPLIDVSKVNSQGQVYWRLRAHLRV